LLDAYRRAANYLSVGQIYLLNNPLLRLPLEPAHVKPRPLGHFGTTPGLNLVYAHLNRAIRDRDLSTLYITGPGHGGPGIIANAYLEGTYVRDAEAIRHEPGVERWSALGQSFGGFCVTVAGRAVGLADRDRT
jgi:xylulose-5-phosphate/fructose-6-phosphate phosphoketolase